MKPRVSDTNIKTAIALIGDLHFGSIYSLMRHPFITHDGRSIIPSFEQHMLNSIFGECMAKAAYWGVDSIIFTGDLIQGQNVKEIGRSLITTDLEEQKDMAIQYLKPICKGKKVYGVSGTQYHKSIDTDVEKSIIESLGGKFMEKMAWLKIEGSNRIINVAHESAVGTIYPFSTMEREATMLLKAYAEAKLPYKPDIIIRGHQHKFAHLHTISYHFILVPSFQVWYPYTTKYYGARQSDLGIVILFVDLLDRVIVHHYTSPINIHIGDKTYAKKEN